MGWDGNKLHYFFNGVEISPQNNSEYGQLISYHESRYSNSDSGSIGFFEVKMPWGIERILSYNPSIGYWDDEKRKYIRGYAAEYSIDYKIK